MTKKKKPATPELPIANQETMQFPCDFPIKIIGQSSDAFEIEVLSIIHKHFPDIKESALKSRPSKNGKYQSITVTVLATSKAQLDAVYKDLTASKLISLVF